MHVPTDPTPAAVVARTWTAHAVAWARHNAPSLGTELHRLPARLAAVTTVTMHPDPAKLPGGSTLQTLTDGVGGWALILALVGMVVGAAAWALGAHSQNYQQSFIGRRTVLISGLAALVIGAAPAIVNFFFHAGQGVH